MAYHFQLYIRFIWILTGMLFTGILHSQSKDDAALYAIWSDTTKPEIERIDAYFNMLNESAEFRIQEGQLHIGRFKKDTAPSRDGGTYFIYEKAK